MASSVASDLRALLDTTGSLPRPAGARAPREGRELVLDAAPLAVLVDHLRHVVEDGGLPVGTIRTWKGDLKVKKLAPGKWVLLPKRGQPRPAPAATPAAAVAKAPAEPATKSAPAKDAPAAGASAAPKGMAGITAEPTAPPPEGAPVLNPNPPHDAQGRSKAARVGLCGTCTAPPAKVPRLPNLTPDERAAESRFADAYEKDPDAVVKAYRDKLASRELGDAPNVFATDDVKLLSPDYNPEGTKDEVMEGRARYNTATHQTANAVAKRAFTQRLDELAKLPKDDPQRTVLVTSGGVASGKGYCLGNVKEASDVVKTAGAVWDAAGEQNATENPWVRDELKKRGLKGVFAFVDSDPDTRWENPKLGVVERAKKIGRMVDARLFADSYADGAKNFDAFQKDTADDPDIQTLVLSSRTNPPSRTEHISKESLGLDADKIYAHASQVIDARDDLPARVRRGASTGRRIWGAPAAKAAAREDRRVRAEAKPMPPSRGGGANEKLVDQLLKNLTKHLKDPAALEDERDARDFKAKPLKLAGGKPTPPPLDAHGVHQKK